MQVIDVDPELQREAVKRTLTVDGNDLIAYVFTRGWSPSHILNEMQDICDFDSSTGKADNEWLSGECRSSRQNNRRVWRGFGTKPSTI